MTGRRDYRAETADLLRFFHGGEPEEAWPEVDAVVAHIRHVHLLDPAEYTADDAAAITEHLPANHAARVGRPRARAIPGAS